MERKLNIKRALSPAEVVAKRMLTMPFEGAWYAHMGQPERAGSWIVWGPSGNGKTRYCLMLGKYLTGWGRVAYNSLEEGISESLKRAVMDSGLVGVRRFVLLDKEPIDELMHRLSRPKSPDIVIVDSIQYSGLNYRSYRDLLATYRSKLFIWVSHADGREPAGRTARSIRYDANVKVYVEGYRAYAVSRYGGGQPYTIWEQGAERIYGTLNTTSHEDK